MDLIFKVTAIENLKIHGGQTTVFSENTVTSFLVCFVCGEIRKAPIVLLKKTTHYLKLYLISVFRVPL